VDIKLAEKAMEDARGTFAVKTTNKVYVSPKTNPGMLTDSEVSGQTKLMELMPKTAELDKAIRRNKDQLASTAFNLRTNNPQNGTPYERGKKMSEDKMCLATGNCGEQAAVAAFLAIKSDPNVKAKTYLVTVCPPGDHVFCVTDLSTAPSWKNVADMVKDFGNCFGIVIDPWMNFACHVSEYEQEAEKKMKQWLSKGKRIWWQGNDVKNPKVGWYQPGGDYVARFLDSPLTYEKAA